MIPCNTSPASEDYADFIVRYSPRAVESLYELAGTTCVNLVSQEFAIVHVPLAGVLPFQSFTVCRIPRHWKAQAFFRSSPSPILQVPDKGYS